jgi:hypothetical protein
MLELEKKMNESRGNIMGEMRREYLHILDNKGVVNEQTINQNH